ncbi:MAG TPA: SAM-dependent chlorinase/fluorinase, partial [Candidatus Limnocylindrales bacterium]
MADAGSPPFVSVTADFGPVATAICRGVILTIAPRATVIDLTADVPAFDIRAGSLALWYALPWVPVGTHVAVIDPGVGTGRRGVALEAGRGDVLVGPDNGLLIAAAERLGGIRRVHALASAAHRLPTVSSTFHGRDVFAPAAGHVAAGTPIEALGPALDPETLVRLPEPRPDRVEDGLAIEVLNVDSFGNLYLGGVPDDLAAALGALEVDRRLRVGDLSVVWAETFGHVGRGEALVFEDSDGRLCLALNQASAADRL